MGSVILDLTVLLPLSCDSIVALIFHQLYLPYVGTHGSVNIIMSPFKRLIRFKSTSAEIFYGEAGSITNLNESFVGKSVPVFHGGNPWDPDFRLTDQYETISEVSERDVVECKFSIILFYTNHFLFRSSVRFRLCQYSVVLV